MKRGQMELIGLVVIVILVTLGMLFMVQFKMKEDKTKKVFTSKGLAYSTMSAILKTTVSETDCVSNYRGGSLLSLGKDVLDDCAKNYENALGGGYSLYQCGGMHSCAYFSEKTKELLDATLKVWGKQYYFESKLITYGGPVETLVQIGTECPKGVDVDTSGIFPINSEAGLTV